VLPSVLDNYFKGAVPRDFRLLVILMISSPKHLSVLIRPFRIFSKIRGDIRGSRCTTSVVDTGGKWKKSSIRKILIILFGHLWVVELTYIRDLPPVSTTLAKMVAKFATGVPVVHLALQISPRIFEKFETFLMGYSGAGGKLIHEKNLLTLSLKSFS
jgi:hypothetical protein